MFPNSADMCVLAPKKIHDRVLNIMTTSGVIVPKGVVSRWPRCGGALAAGSQRGGTGAQRTRLATHWCRHSVTNTRGRLTWRAGLWASIRESWSRPILRNLTISIEW